MKYWYNNYDSANPAHGGVMPNDMDTQELVRLFEECKNAPNDDAMNDLLKFLWPYVFRIAYKQVRMRLWFYESSPTNLAEEFTNEALLRFYMNFSKINTVSMNGTDSTILAWFHKTIVNLAIDEHRKRIRRPEETITDTPTITKEDVQHQDDMELSTTLTDALLRLSLEHREILFLVYLRGHEPLEMTKMLGIPEGSVKSRLHYARRALRKALENTPKPSVE
jgi:RNA polymerase sigma-70 factor, ECF subfamily